MRHCRPTAFPSFLGALLVLASLGPAWAAEPAALPQGEFLFMVPPDGWIVGSNARQADRQIIEYVPSGQSVRQWTEMVTVQVYFGRANAPLLEYVQGVLAALRPLCKTFRAPEPEMSHVGGYNTAVSEVECRDPDRDKAPAQVRLKAIEYFAMRAIQGRDGFYVVQRAWHGDAVEHDSPLASEEKRRQWAAFLREVEVCDTRDPAFTCRMLGLLPPAEAEAFARREGWPAMDGCRHLGTLTVLPEVAKGMKPFGVVTLALGRGRFGDDKAERDAIGAIMGMARENRAVAVIVTVGAKVVASLAERRAQMERDVESLRTLLLKQGVSAPRIVIRRNPDCGG